MNAAALAALAVFGAAAPVCAAPEPTPTPASPLAHRGFVTERSVAERAIRFAPYRPDLNPLAVALEPPFHGDQVSANEGIAYAYARGTRTWILSEWPQNGGSLAEFAPLQGVHEQRCGDVHAIGGTAHPHGIAWTTPRGLVMTLLPDGSADARTIVAEWRRLVRTGAC